MKKSLLAVRVADHPGRPGLAAADPGAVPGVQAGQRPQPGPLQPHQGLFRAAGQGFAARQDRHPGQDHPGQRPVHGRDLRRSQPERHGKIHGHHPPAGPGRGRRGRSRAAGLRRQGHRGRHLQPALHRDRLLADVHGAGLSPGRRRGRRHPGDPGQRHPGALSLGQPRRADHGSGMVRQDQEHGIRGHGRSLPLPLVRRPRRQPRLVQGQPEGDRPDRHGTVSQTGSRRWWSTSTRWAAAATGCSSRPTRTRPPRGSIPWSGAASTSSARASPTTWKSWACQGVASRGEFTGWWIGSLDDTAWFHNIPGILFEGASVRLAIADLHRARGSGERRELQERRAGVQPQSLERRLVAAFRPGELRPAGHPLGAGHGGAPEEGPALQYVPDRARKHRPRRKRGALRLHRSRASSTTRPPPTASSRSCSSPTSGCSSSPTRPASATPCSTRGPTSSPWPSPTGRSSRTSSKRSTTPTSARTSRPSPSCPTTWPAGRCPWPWASRRPRSTSR